MATRSAGPVTPIKPTCKVFGREIPKAVAKVSLSEPMGVAFTLILKSLPDWALLWS
jgi:hypothetical protein